MPIYLVLSHYEDGPSIWIRSSRESAERLVGKLFLQELQEGSDMINRFKEFEPEVLDEIDELMSQEKFMEANDLWMETQKEAYPELYTEGYEIRSGEIDGESAE